MKMRVYALIAIVVMLTLVVGVAYAQGHGRGRMGQGAGAGCPMMGAGPGARAGTCPMGLNQPNMNAGGWWMRAKPATKEQKAFLDEVRGLHDRIRLEQADLARLQTVKGDPKRIAALEKDLTALRTRLHDTMIKNRPLMTQMGVPAGPGMWCDPAKCANCPYKADCPCYANGKCVGPQGVCPMDPAKCANCPLRGQPACPKTTQTPGVCPRTGSACPMAK